MKAPSLSVLLIEDNVDHRALIEGYVRRSCGLTVETVDRLSAGLERMDADEFDAVFLDLHLPDSRGLETLETAVERAPDLPVIVLTTIDDEETAIEAVKRGAQDYLTKDNVTAEVLRRSVRYAAERKRVEKALRSTEEQLRHSQKMEAMGRVAAGVAHDFNNLLTIINGYGDELARRLEGDSRSLRYVESIRRAGERAADLTGQLLAFTRMQVSEPEVLNLGTLVAETTQMFHPLIGKSIDLRVDEGPGDLYVKADGNHLTQVLLNLVINSQDAMPDGGVLTIGTGVVDAPDSDRDRLTFLKVSDTGSGMDQETRARLFEPFFTTKKGKGTGLGLSTVYGIVTQIGGHITVDTEKGEGTVFTVFLPAVEQVVGSAAESQSGDNLDSTRAGVILLVDDEQAIRELLREALERAGYSVLGADGAEAALESATRCGEIDLLVTDIVMPGLNGFALAEQLTSSQPSMEVFYMSGYADNQSDTTVRLRNEKNYIQKPFSVTLFLKRVQEILARRGLVGEC